MINDRAFGGWRAETPNTDRWGKEGSQRRLPRRNDIEAIKVENLKDRKSAILQVSIMGV